MESDSESFAKLLYSTGVPEKWKDNPEFYSYLNKLGTLSIDSLGKEPDHVSSEKLAVINQTQDLAFNNYKTFIQTAECSRKMLHEFKHAEKSLDSVINQVPQFSKACEEFLNLAKEIKIQRKLNAVCLTKHSSVLQILETLQLMECVIREEMYEEALQLAAFIRRMAKTHPNIPILQSMVSEVDSAWWVLVSRLVGRLRCELQLPACLLLMGHLRRMDVLSPPELRIKFLQARDYWFSSQLAAIPNEDAAFHLSKVIELSRTYLFNIMTQYKAVFSDEESTVVSSKQQFNYIPILLAWINDKVVEFINILEKDLSAVVATALPALLNQAMNFGQSLSRVGCDIRFLIVQPFVNTIGKLLTDEFEKASSLFIQDMSKFQLSNANLFVYTCSIDDTKQPSPVAPPRALLEFYPFSHFCNNLLGGFNIISSCGLLSLSLLITQGLQNALVAASRTLLDFYQREQQAMSEEERKYFSNMCACFSEVLVPYIQLCLHTVYPPTEMSAFLGIPTFKIEAEGLTYLDTLEITDMIKFLLPPKPPITSVANSPPQVIDHVDTTSEALLPDSAVTSTEVAPPSD